MEWKKAVKKEEQTYWIPERWIHIHYYEALNILFRVENSLRVFTYVVLKNVFFEKWIDVSISGDDQERGTIDSIAKRRIRQIQNFGYLGYSISCPIMHLTSGDLIGIIFSEAYWKYFAPYFKGRKDTIKDKLNEIGTIRNTLAHFRPMRPDDVEVVQQYAKQTLMEIERLLSNISRFTDVVPTNTEDKWYKLLKSLSTELINNTIKQSIDSQWVQFSLKYIAPVINENVYDDYASYTVAKLFSAAVLSECVSVRNHVTYMNESSVWTRMPERGSPDFSKNLGLVFKKEVLANNIESIMDDLNKLASKIDTETTLIREDHLARGKLIAAQGVFASLQKQKDGSSRWKFFKDDLKCDVTENDPTEYWGSLNYAFDDIISGTTKYPWMPVDISSYESPF